MMTYSNDTTPLRAMRIIKDHGSLYRTFKNRSRYFKSGLFFKLSDSTRLEFLIWFEKSSGKRIQAVTIFLTALNEKNIATHLNQAISRKMWSFTPLLFI